MLFALFRSFLFWFGLIWLIVGSCFVGFGIKEQRIAIDASRSALRADAIVLSKTIQRANRGDTPRTRYRIEYRFRVDDLDYTRSADIGVEAWEALEEGGPVRISYLPDDFHTSRVGVFDDGASSLIAVGLGSIFAIIGGFLVVKEWRAARIAGALAGPAPPIWIQPGAFRRFLEGAWGLTQMLGVVLGAILLSELVPPVRDAALYIDQRQSMLLAIVIGGGVLGLVLMMGGILHMVIAGGQAADSFSFESMKAAWRDGAWRHSVVWRRRFITAIGATLLFFGLFGLFIVIGPAWVKALMAGAVVYAVVRTVSGLRRS